jgi:hypothetical protein
MPFRFIISSLKILDLQTQSAIDSIKSPVYFKAIIQSFSAKQFRYKIKGLRASFRNKGMPKKEVSR